MKPRTGSIIVFSGPSLAWSALQSNGDVAFHGPARCGDLLRAAQRSPRAICLIDGTFESHPAVWHKEILYALQCGIPVVGAASMGALRAVECASFGMIGLGYVFEKYMSGELTCDSDVAVVHAPAELGYQPLSLALVDVLHATTKAMNDGRVSRPEQERLVTAARSIGFRDRTWERVVDDSKLPREVVRTMRAAGDFNGSIKTADARAALEFVAGMEASPEASPGWEFQESQFFATLKARIGNAGQSGF